MREANQQGYLRTVYPRVTQPIPYPMDFITVGLLSLVAFFSRRRK